MIYYTRATRDQLTGILYGIGVALAELDPADYSGETALGVLKVRDILQEVIRAVWGRLESTWFVIRDQEGETGTTASLVTGLLNAAAAGGIPGGTGTTRGCREYGVPAH